MPYHFSQARETFSHWCQWQPVLAAGAYKLLVKHGRNLKGTFFSLPEAFCDLKYAKNAFAIRALPLTRWVSLRRSPRPTSRQRRGHPSPNPALPYAPLPYPASLGASILARLAFATRHLHNAPLARYRSVPLFETFRRLCFAWIPLWSLQHSSYTSLLWRGGCYLTKSLLLLSTSRAYGLRFSGLI